MLLVHIKHSLSPSDDNEDGMAADDEAEERLERASMKLKVLLFSSQYNAATLSDNMPKV